MPLTKDQLVVGQKYRVAAVQERSFLWPRRHEFQGKVMVFRGMGG